MTPSQMIQAHQSMLNSGGSIGAGAMNQAQTFSEQQNKEWRLTADINEAQHNHEQARKRLLFISIVGGFVAVGSLEGLGVLLFGWIVPSIILGSIVSIGTVGFSIFDYYRTKKAVLIAKATAKILS